MLNFFMKNWIKTNWWIVILFVVLFVGGRSNTIITNRSQSIGSKVSMMPATGGEMYFGTAVAPSDSSERIIIKNSSFGLQVKEVSKTVAEIEKITKAAGGFLIDSNISKPGESTNATISVRIPSEKVDETVASFKKLAVKIVSESVIGDDVTDQYTDLEARLEILNKTKAKYEEILAKAFSVSDLLNVQQHLSNLQTQIDSIKGQKKYLEQSAKLSKVTIYLSTDELSLPYTPDNQWRPSVIFKQAVRNLVLLLRVFGSILIYALVFSPVIVAGLLIVRWIKRKTIKV
jgi:hypothetical protein